MLPPNASPQEVALSGAISLASDVPVPLRDVWNPDTCPPELLAWLAWAFSVDQWDANWTAAQQREFIKRSVQIHRYKGTIGAVQDALAALFLQASVQEWHSQSPQGDPFTFAITLMFDQQGVNQAGYAALFEVVERTKNLRSHLTSVRPVIRSEAGPMAAIVPKVGNDIVLFNYARPLLIFSENAVVLKSSGN